MDQLELQTDWVDMMNSIEILRKEFMQSDTISKYEWIW
jgi:hypothetical protein